MTAGPVVSLTRLRLRSARFLPAFARDTLRSARQVRRAPGFLGGAVLADRRRTFWTLTAWADEAALRACVRVGAHGAAMPRLLAWCDEASTARWPGGDLPTWAEAAERMRALGRPSRVRRPSADHAGLAFPDPRPTLAVPLAAPLAAPLRATRVASTRG